MNLQFLKEIDITESIAAWHSIANKVVQDDNKISNSMKLVMEEYKEVMEAYLQGDNTEHLMHEIADLIFVLINVMYVHGYVPRSVLLEVTASNYSKFFNKQNYHSHKSKVDEHCNEKELQLKKVNEEVMCLVDNNSKIKKGVFYNPVDYSNFIKLSK